MGVLIDKLRLRIADRVRPSTHRLIMVEDGVHEPSVAANDLIRGGDALSRGWGCDPAILYNAAALLRSTHE